MSDKRNRQHVVSVRVDPGELEQLQGEAERRGVTISRLLRDVAIDGVRDDLSREPNAVRLLPTLEAAVVARPGRLIDVRATKWNRGQEITIGADGARELAAALLTAASVAEQRNSDDEALDAEHRDTA